jgi:hypothetical protein
MKQLSVPVSVPVGRVSYLDPQNKPPIDAFTERPPLMTDPH